MLNADFKTHLESTLNTTLTEIRPLSGGDINDVYLLKTEEKHFVIKVNDAKRYPNMFDLEAKGLQELRQAESFQIPKVIQVGNFGTNSFLILEYIDAKPKHPKFAEIFGNSLVKMHQATAPFGFAEDNYIGSLPQYNTQKPDAASFYIEQRLLPQFEMASRQGYSFKNLNRFFNTITDLIPLEPASLIHGDLWGGNYIINEQGFPALIDPATCYAPREMDLAMMQLFGGFEAEIFNVYNEAFPLAEGWQSRIKLWQLYYILVHVNLFGGHYYNTAKSILKTYR